MAETYNILPTRVQSNPSLQISPEYILSASQKATQQEFEEKKWKAQQPNTIDKILSYAGTALNMYSKWTDIETKKLDQDNTKLQQQVSTLQLEQARIKAQTQNAQLEKDTKYSQELTKAMESGDPNQVYSVMMSNLEAVKNNPELTQMATEFCVSKGMDRENFDVFNPKEAALMRKIQAKSDAKIAQEEAKAKYSATTPEQKANEAINKEAEKAVLSLGNSLASNTKMVSAFSPVVPTIATAEGPDDLKRAIYTGEITCTAVPNYEEEIGKLYNSPNYNGILSGAEDNILPYTKKSDNMSDINAYSAPSEEGATDISVDQNMSVTVADPNKLANVFVCTNNVTGATAVIPMNSEDSKNFQKILGEGARRKKGYLEATSNLGINPNENVSSEQSGEAPKNASASIPKAALEKAPWLAVAMEKAPWLAEAYTKAQEMYQTNPEKATQTVVLAIQSNIKNKAGLKKAVAEFVGITEDISNPNEILHAYFDAKLSGKSEEEATKAAKAVVRGKNGKPTKEETASKKQETPTLIKLKEEFDKLSDEEKAARINNMTDEELAILKDAENERDMKEFGEL